MSVASAIYDGVLAVGEVGVRQIYWRMPALVSRLRSRRHRPAGDLLRVRCDRLADYLHEIGTGSAGLLMVHSSMGRFQAVDAEGNAVRAGKMALWLLNTLREVVGEQGTLCMPTHPLYRNNPGFMCDKSALHLSYSVKNTPSSAGLLTEFLRRQKDCLRSLHPLSSLAACGPWARGLLENNLHDGKPLPHGIDSGYYRFCREGGKVISIGLPLIKTLSIAHVAEEVRDLDWPVKGFFYQRHFAVEDEDSMKKEVVVRERRPLYVRSLPLQRLRRDFLREGLLRESTCDDVRVDVCDAKGVFEFMTDKQRASTYPYLLPALASWGRPPRVSGVSTYETDSGY